MTESKPAVYTLGGYSLRYDRERNQIIICLPQTAETVVSTAQEISEREADVTENDLLAILWVTRNIFEEGDKHGSD